MLLLNQDRSWQKNNCTRNIYYVFVTVATIPSCSVVFCKPSSFSNACIRDLVTVENEILSGNVNCVFNSEKIYSDFVGIFNMGIMGVGKY